MADEYPTYVKAGHVADVEIEYPTANLRFKGGRLQQAFNINTWRHGMETLHRVDWRDVPSVTDDTKEQP